jgi:hypothetical protein
MESLALAAEVHFTHACETHVLNRFSGAKLNAV